jgi:NAD(P)-dependent dehydrogenase (short-subunit alcohol dehydrogenase family)
MLLDDRVVIVTGVGPGLGLAIARATAQQGAQVVLAARSKERLDEHVAGLTAEGHRAIGVATDVTDEDQCGALVARTVDELGRLDGLVNSAFQQPPFETVEELTMDTWRHAFEINCHAAVQMTKAAIPALRAASAPSVVMITTMSIHRNRPRFTAYASAKAATATLARGLAAELGPDGIRVNSVAPGYIWGDPVRGFLQAQAEQRGRTYEEELAELESEMPLRRVPKPEAIADAVVFYLSDLARDVTGTMLDVNCGQIMPS